MGHANKKMTVIKYQLTAWAYRTYVDRTFKCESHDVQMPDSNRQVEQVKTVLTCIIR